MKKSAPDRRLPAYLAIGGMYALAALPWWSYRLFASMLTVFAFLFTPGKVRIAMINIRLCFPHFSRTRRGLTLVRCLYENSLWLGTTSRVWLRPHSLNMIYQRCTVTGIEHIHNALKTQQPTILCAAHQPHLDLTMAIFHHLHLPFCASYRPYRSPIFNAFMLAKRRTMATAMVSIKSLRQVAQACKQHKLLWLAPDQDPGRRVSVFVPFLGVQAAHNQGIRRMARICDAQVCCLTIERVRGWRWHLTIHPPLANFPSADIEQDTRAQNQPLERALRAYPHNYLWMHRRFKTQPPGHPSPYINFSSLQQDAGH